MKNYDYIIAGGGCAGLSMAYYLSQSQLAGASVLIIDREVKVSNDRTWCFWASQSIFSDAIISHQWSHLSFVDKLGSKSSHLDNYQYNLIRSADFYRFTKSTIQQKPNFDWLQGTISNTGEDEQGAFVLVNGERYYAKWVFDSCFNWQDWQRFAGNHQFLLQHFQGWFIETEEPIFAAQQATLMDFRTPQQDNARFLYVLPFSENKALVEYTVFSQHLETDSAYEHALDDYLKNRLGINNYRILEKERGVIPMTDLQLSWDGKSRIVPIGTPGGAVKPTTGYAFLRIQDQVAQIVQSLVQNGRPTRPKNKQRFRFYDRLLLSILQHEGGMAAPIFSDLFRKNDVNRILNFLDERTSIWEEIQIFTKLPLLPFLRAIKRVYLTKTKVNRKMDLQMSIIKD